MVRRVFFTLALLIFSTSIAYAQGEFYITWSNTHFTNIASGAQQTNFWASGIGGGATVTFLPLPVVSLGMDIRASTRPGTDGADTALAGIKLAIHPPGLPFKPYIQVSGGYAGTRTTRVPGGGSVSNHYAAWEILGGVDYPLAHMVDWRVIELGGGQAVNTGTSSPSLFTVNTGLVIHF